ncbi:uncharacterized protein FFB14_11741 [Fusarium fujikuroi]|nr:uncharacterized protein FFB14_11741 [Fusarium fujikuroi]
MSQMHTARSNHSTPPPEPTNNLPVSDSQQPADVPVDVSVPQSDSSNFIPHIKHQT